MSVELAKLVKDELNNAAVDQFSKIFGAVRGHEPRDEARRIGEHVRIVVANGATSTEQSTRRTTLKKPAIWICVLARVDGCTSTDDQGDLTPTDEMINFVDELHAFFMDEHGGPAILSNGKHAWQVESVSSDPLYDSDALKAGIFQSVTRIDFEMTDGIP